MKIGVMSDTHLRVPNELLEHVLVNLLADADMILHAGDIVSRRVLERLEESRVVAVCGNMDDYEVLGSVPQARIISAAGKKLGLIHGWGSKDGLAHRIISYFGRDRPEVIVFGHSHEPFAGEVDGTYMFNPGSASQNRYMSSGTVGIMEISEDQVTGKFLTLP